MNNLPSGHSTNIVVSVHQAFVSYLRSVYLQKDKSIFKLNELPVERFSEALGLPGMPKIKFLSREMAKKRKNASRAVVGAGPSSAGPQNDEEQSDDDGSETSGDETSDEEEEDSSPVVAPTSTGEQKVRTVHAVGRSQ